MKSSYCERFGQRLCAVGFASLVACEASVSPAAAPTAATPKTADSVATEQSQADWLGDRPPVAESPPFVPPTPEVYKTAGGLQVWLIERHALPAVSVSVALPVGSANDPKGSAGLAFVTTEMLTEGAGQRGSADLARALDTLGARVTTTTHTDASLISLAVLKKDFGPALTLLGDIVARPRFEAADWKRVSDLWRSDLKARASDPVEVVHVVTRSVLFGEDHAYGHPVEGTIKSGARVSLDDVKRFYASMWLPETANIVVAGDITRGELDPLLDEAFKSWKRPAPRAAAPPPAAVAKPTGPWPRVVLVDRPDAPQANIAFIRPSVTATDPDVPLIKRANIAFGGSFTSRINLDLREEHGWSYGARSTLFTGRSAGALVAYAAVFVDKTGEALSALLADADAFAKKGLTDEEVIKTKAQARADAVVEAESIVSLASRLASQAALGLPADSDAQANRKRDAANQAELNAVALSNFDPTQAIVVIVGPRTKIAPQLQAAGLPAPEIRDAEGNKLP